ncbi:class ii aldolase and adducin domain-containing [Trichoderma arundinaceum]|uniref:Class ii aldolase and adducin domain-containing n=1 Tax=Trichoderma arundinaceum TaxID=490622 RepID=A0A395NHL1_TRIAR|nr:class ii aldolase and adducin domain-containing [Trichoderma arundinaceum]
MAVATENEAIGLPGDELIRKYVHGCHILHYYNIVDAYGHLSVRLSESVFMMSRYMAPALVTTADDMVLYDVESGEALRKDAPKGFSERFIHSEVYKVYPEVQAVVHSHSLEVVPFSISSTPLRACFHMAGFLGTAVPVWDAATVYRENPAASNNMLVRSTEMGASLAKALGPADDQGLPKYPVALMRGHGFVATANSIEMVICKSIYTTQNAQVQRAAVAISGGMEEVRFFNEREARDTGSTTTAGAAKPWPLWVAEVESHPLYKNAV